MEQERREEKGNSENISYLTDVYLKKILDEQLA